MGNPDDVKLRKRLHHHIDRRCMSAKLVQGSMLPNLVLNMIDGQALMLPDDEVGNIVNDRHV